ncbi:MAG: SMP-30/gluconolactonase/LRE family protein [Solirubrobacteraceae bacterium]
MRRLALVVLLACCAVTPAATAQAARAKWDTRTLALIPKPGYPAHAYVHPNGRVYEGTYDNPQGDSLASRVFEFTGAGTLLHSWTIQRQNTGEPHGVQVATSDAKGRLILLDKSPPRAIVLNRGNGRQRLYGAFPGAAVPNYGAWGPDGSLYVTDYESPVIWRIPPHGGRAVEWLRDPALDGETFGATGLQLMADNRTLLVATQSAAGLAFGNPTTGRLLKVPIAAGGKAGKITQLWESRPLDGPDGFAIAKSGSIYVALLLANQIAEVGPDGVEKGRSPTTGFDNPSNAQFLGKRLMVANQSYVLGDASKQAVLDVWVGEPGLKRLIPRTAGPR